MLPAPYETWEKTYAVSYSPSAAAFRTGNELYIAGRKPDGTTIIERWDLPHTQGAYFSDRTSLWPSVPFGAPLTTGPLSIGIEGGTYTNPSQRSAPTPAVVTVYSGATIGLVRALTVDPDGRFLLAIEETSGGQLIQLRLTTPQTVHVVATEGQFPGLIDGGALTPIDQSQSGRMYITYVGHDVVWIDDAANDGILDGTSILDFRGFSQAFPKVTWSMIYP